MAACTDHRQSLLGHSAVGRHDRVAEHIAGHRLRGLYGGLLQQPIAALIRHGYAQIATHVAPGERSRIGLNLRRCALRHHAPAVHAGTRAHVYAMVGGADHVFVMLDHQHAVTYVTQMFQSVYQPVVVTLMQTNAGFVQHIHHTSES